jgi:hypothetical protein
MSIRAVAISALLLVALFAGSACAGHVCQNSDCSDVVGEHLVQDNLGTSLHFTESHHDDWAEEARLRRIDILRREKAAL